MGRYDCKIKVDGEFKPVLTFDLQFIENWINDPTSPTKTVMSWALEWQTDLTVTDGAFTGKHRVATPQ